MLMQSPAVSSRSSTARGPRPLSITCVMPFARGARPRSNSLKDSLQSLASRRLDVAEDGVAVRVDPDRERTEVPDAETPEALGHQLLPRDLLDLLDLGRLERSRPADDREVDHAEALHRLDCLVGQAALAADRAHAVALAERLGEAHHPRARRRADRDRLVAARAQLADARRGVQEEGAGEIHRRLDALVEDANLRPVADADDVPLHRDLVARAKLEDLLRIGNRERDF